MLTVSRGLDGLKGGSLAGRIVHRSSRRSIDSAESCKRSDKGEALHVCSFVSFLGSKRWQEKKRNYKCVD